MTNEKENLCIFYESVNEKKGICERDNSYVNKDSGCLGDYHSCRKIKIIGKNWGKKSFLKRIISKIYDACPKYDGEEELISSSAEHYPKVKESKLEDKSHADGDLLEK